MLTLTETLRIARKLERVWAARAQSAPAPPLDWSPFETSLTAVRQAEHRIQLARRHRLTHIVTRLQENFSHQLEEFARQVDALRVGTPAPAVAAPDLTHWVGEVRQLGTEFGGLTVRWPVGVLRVVTESVELEDVTLGPFAIEFGWSVPHRRAFEVVALDPNPATGKREIVHPHVEGRRLCTGEATQPILRALDEGRLADACLLVQSVLQNYNPHSAYVALEEWDGFRCARCAHRGPARDRDDCPSCDDPLCRNCADSCARCSETRCSDCLQSCDVCSEACCGGCLHRTPSERSVCSECRTDCPACGITVATDEIADERCRACALIPSSPLEMTHVH
jgi:hypothetical protein